VTVFKTTPEFMNHQWKEGHMSDSITGGATVVGRTQGDPSVTMTLGMTFDSTTGQKPGALAALKAVVKKWGKEYGVNVDFDGPTELP
jgi:hypothetical protein